MMGMSIEFNDEVFGYKMTFQFENWDIFGEELGDDDNFNGAEFSDLYGSVKVIPDMLDLQLGLMSIDTFRYDAPAGGDWAGFKIGDIWHSTSLMLMFAPKGSGIKAMVNYQVPMAPDLSEAEWYSIGNGASVEDCIQASDLCVSYTIPDTATVTLGTLGTNCAFGDPGRPIFGGVKLNMIPDMDIILAGHYVIAEDQDTMDDSIYTVAGITYRIGPATIKVGNMIFVDLAADPDVDGSENVVNFKIGTSAEYVMGDFLLAFYGNYYSEYNEWAAEPGNEGTLELQPCIKHNPTGIQVGAWIWYNMDQEYLEWTIPVQIDFSF
jgi:hypothetical protein